VQWVHFPLHPDTPNEGKELASLDNYRGVDLKQRQAEMKARMDAEGLPYGERTHTYNSRLAQELGKWADTQEGGEPLHDALYRAYFVDCRNIGDPDVLLAIVKETGLSVEEAAIVIEERTFKQSVDEDWSRAHASGVTGVPTFVAGGYGVVGAQPYEVLEKLVAHVNEEAAGATDSD
jgi:predicted DsbA family dithiol-disulfide isomerase